MTTYPLPTLASSIDSSGISAVQFANVRQSLIASMQQIFGSDIYLGSDSQDGQMIGVLAQAIFDTNQLAVNVFNNFSPTNAQEAALSSLVKINGIKRNVSSASTAIGNVVGTVGTVINNGIVSDDNGNLWGLPSIVTIPDAGYVTVTVVCQTVGAVSAATGTINAIFNPQLGWQSFTNTSPATLGNAVEKDSQLKARQTQSTSLPAQSIIDGILSNVANVSGVARFTGYDNDTSLTDSNGVPAHTIAITVKGGSNQDIVNAIGNTKPPGIPTFGTTSGSYVDSYGVAKTIHYSTLSEVNIYFAFTIKALNGYVSTTGTLIAETLAAFINTLSIGEDVYATQAMGAASLANLTIGQTFSIQMASFKLGTSSSPTTSTDIAIAFNAAAICSAANITITVI